MARINGVTTRFAPALGYTPTALRAGMAEDPEGQYVSLEDYEHALGVIRKLKAKIAKKERRHKAMLHKDESSEFITLEEKKAVKVGEKFRISGHWSCKEPRIAFIDTLYNRACGDFGIIVLFGDTGYTQTIGNASLQQHDFKMERVQ